MATNLCLYMYYYEYALRAPSRQKKPLYNMATISRQIMLLYQKGTTVKICNKNCLGGIGNDTCYVTVYRLLVKFSLQKPPILSISVLSVCCSLSGLSRCGGDCDILQAPGLAERSCDQRGTRKVAVVLLHPAQVHQ